SFAEQSDIRSAIAIARLHFTRPEASFNTDACRENCFVLESFSLRERDVLSSPELFETIRAAKVNSRPFADHESIATELADLALDAALHHAHGGHHDDDGKHADQHTEQCEGRTQLVSCERAHSHEKTLTDFAQDGDRFLFHV